MRIRRVITTRQGGHSQAPFDSLNFGGRVGDDPSALAANTRHLADGIGVDEKHLVWMEQVHSNNVAVIDGPRDEPVEATDAVVTSQAGLALAALTADCVPVLLGDPEAGVIAAVHAGRVGARVGVAEAAVRTMCELGARPESIEGLLGPAVCGECYEVPADMQRDFEAHVPKSACRTRSGTPGLELRAGLWNQLAAMGVGKLGLDPRCTVESPELFSHRRDGKTGRFAAVIWMDPSQRDPHEIGVNDNGG